VKDRPSKGKGARKEVTTAEYLRAVPFKNQAMEVTPKSGGGVLVSVPLKRPKYMVPPLSWILPFSSHRRVELDALGAEVLDLCDGKRIIEAIIERFASAHKLTFREAQLAVTEFLRQLTQRGLVAIVGRKETGKG